MKFDKVKKAEKISRNAALNSLNVGIQTSKIKDLCKFIDILRKAQVDAARKVLDS